MSTLRRSFFRFCHRTVYRHERVDQTGGHQLVHSFISRSFAETNLCTVAGFCNQNIQQKRSTEPYCRN